MTNKKFILMNMNDSRSKKIAEVMGNKTCKNILDYLAETKEASQQDIADDLNMPINTVDYNIKKLVESGLVDKAKNFFWSKKGKKIIMYKLAKKHIVISPKSSKPNLTALKTILPIFALILIGMLGILILNQSNPQPIEGINHFNSTNDLKNFLKENQISENSWERFRGVLEAGINLAQKTASLTDSAGASDYSQTNIQVQGVDEADIVKNDGKYIYVVSNNKVSIINAYPAENMKILSEIKLNNSINGIFINDNKLIIFSKNYSPILYKTRCIDSCPSYNEQETQIYIYDLSDRESPEQENTITFSGNYFDSRMIGDYVYVIANQYIQEDIVLPYVKVNEKKQVVEAENIYYSDFKDTSFQYTNILAVNVKNGKTNEKTVLTGRTSNLYVSQKNIYATQYKNTRWYGIKNWDYKNQQKTLINKISINKGKINFVAEGEVPGNILNQFSMDEHDDNFRIATTIRGYVDNKDTSTNNLYVLDKNMKIIGKLEGVAPGESIYSVRFMQNRAYMVTFRHIDPLFVIDLKDPKNPKVLGKLKIPGYSDYLHPYDETHLIGIGKEVDASIDADKIHTEGAVYYTAIQGVKLAIFDVSDVEHPVEMYKEVIGDRGTESLATTDHKAFLFDKAKELLVIPITLAELQEGQSKSEQGDYTFQGAYVYHLNLEDGFDLKGRITHYNESDDVFAKSGYYFRGDKSIQRSLYIDDVLYTISQTMIKSNDLDDLDEISSVEWEIEQRAYPETMTY